MFRPFPQTGASIVESILAIAFIGIAGSAVALLIANAYSGAESGGLRTQAAAFGRETYEAVRGIERSAYNRLAAGTYGISESGGIWSLAGSPDISGPFTRSVQIENVNRDGSGNIAGAGTDDVHTRKVTTTIAWSQRGLPKQQQFVDYVTNWARTRFFEDTSADFSDGTFFNASVQTGTDADGALGLNPSNAFFACAAAEGLLDASGNSNGNAVAVSGTRAYLVTDNNAAGAEFYVVDVTDPEQMTVLGSVEVGDTVNAVAVSGNYAFLATNADLGEFVVVDVTTPSSPSVLATLDLAGTGNANEVVVSGTHAYLVRANDAAAAEFFVLGVGTPGAPTVEGSLELGAAANGVALSGAYAFAATALNAGELRVISVSVPTAPSIAATVDLPSGADGQDVVVNGSRLYVVTANNAAGSEFYVVNAVTPTSPSVSGSVDLGLGTLKVETNGTTAMVVPASGANELQFVDATNPALPLLGKAQDLANGAYNGLFWSGSRLFATSADNGAELMSVRVNASPSWACVEKKGVFNAPNGVQTTGLFLSGTTLYAAMTASAGAEFYIVDASNPAAPVQVGSLELGVTANDVVVSGNYAYVASTSNTQELQVIDISVPSAPVLVGSLDAAGNNNAEGIAISGTNILLTQGTNLRKINVATPAAPALLGSVALGGTGFRVKVYNATYAFVSTSTDAAELRVVDYTPATPTLAGLYDASGTADGLGLWIKGTTLYLSTDVNASGAEFYSLNVASPTAPSLIGSLDLGARSEAVAADSGEAFAFSGVNAPSGNLRTLDLGIPASPNQVSILSSLVGNVLSFAFGNGLVYAGTAGASEEIAVIGKVSGGAGYPSLGTYDSGVLDAGAQANWNTIEWTDLANACAPGSVQAQIRTAATALALTTELWQGPDGEDADEADFYSAAAGSLIHPDHNGDRFFQYRVTQTGDGTCTRLLGDIAVTYSLWQ